MTDIELKMASLHTSPPQPFDFATPEEWPRWIRCFEHFREAAGLIANAETSQISTLIYSMGDQAEDILRSFSLTEAQRGKYDIVKEKLEHFVKRRNFIFERAKFNRCVQGPDETCDSFITSLYCLAAPCS